MHNRYSAGARCWVVLATALVLLVCFVRPAGTTDLLSFEGIGTVPRSMGGAALAYDVGGSALANNVSTMLLMPVGQSVEFQLNFDAPNTLEIRDLATGEIATTDRWPVFHAYCRRKIEMTPGAQSRDDTPVGGRDDQRDTASEPNAGWGLSDYCR